MTRTAPWALPCIWVAALAASVAFFLPWVHLVVRDPAVAQALSNQAAVGSAVEQFIGKAGRVTVEIQGPQGTIATDLASLTALPDTLSGFQIPRFLEEERVQAVVAVLQAFRGEPQYWHEWRYMVYAVPGLVLFLAGLVTWGRRWPRLSWAIALVALGIVLWAAWQWLTLDRDTPALTVSIGFGLLASWGAYGLLATGAAALAQQGRALKA